MDPILNKVFENGFKPHLLDERRNGQKQYGGVCPDCKEKRVFSYHVLNNTASPVCEECRDTVLNKVFENGFKPHFLDGRRKGNKQYEGVCPDCKEKVVFSYNYLMCHVKPVCKKCREKQTDLILNKVFENGFKPHLLDEKRKGKKQYSGICPDCKEKKVFIYSYLSNNASPVCKECRERQPRLESIYRALTNRHKQKKAPGDVVLTFEQNNALRINGRCVYSNELGPRKTVVIDGKKVTVKYIGLDRKDSKHGYTLENSVPCATWLNNGKLTMSTASFREKIKTLIKHQLKVMPEEELAVMKKIIEEREACQIP